MSGADFFASPSMDATQWRKCPKCGLPNIPERTLCKRCRTTLAGIPPRPAAATEATGTLYTSADARHQLFVSSSSLEYCGPGITIRTAWANIDSLCVEGGEEYLWLRAPATVRMFRSSDPMLDAWLEQTVPLRCFGYPSNADLLVDLHRFAPQVWTDQRS